MSPSPRSIHFGIQTGQEGTTYEAIRDHWQLAERLGYDSVWVDDHLYAVAQPTRAADQLECWTLMAALARETRTIRFGALVACHSYRPPALTAKMAATLDVLSGGRFEFGYGYGWFEDEYIGYGYPFPSNRVRSAEFGEALEICRRLWTEECVTFEGEHYQVQDAYCAPKPVQDPLPIWIGGSGRKFTLPWVAKYANAWNTPGTLESVREKLGWLDEACAREGRDPAEIRKTWFGHVVIDEDEARLKRRVERRAQVPYLQQVDQRSIIGTPARVAEQMHAYIDAGLDGFLMIFGRIENHQSTELFADSVVPAFR